MTPTAQATLENMQLNALKIADGFDRLAAVLADEHTLETTAANLRERAGKLRKGRFTLMVLGEFKRGKSTLLNAMLGRDLLPRKAAPCTAILTSLRYGTIPAVRVLFTDGHVERLTPQEFTTKYELNNKITMDSSGISIESAKDIQLKATGNVKVSGTAGIDFSSTGKAVLKGTVVNIN